MRVHRQRGGVGGRGGGVKTHYFPRQFFAVAGKPPSPQEFFLRLRRTVNKCSHSRMLLVTNHCLTALANPAFLMPMLKLERPLTFLSFVLLLYPLR